VWEFNPENPEIDKFANGNKLCGVLNFASSSFNNQSAIYRRSFSSCQLLATLPAFVDGWKFANKNQANDMPIG
jgi:hypothetical protein